jgi:hypothetical protein
MIYLWSLHYISGITHPSFHSFSCHILEVNVSIKSLALAASWRTSSDAAICCFSKYARLLASVSSRKYLKGTQNKNIANLSDYIQMKCAGTVNVGREKRLETFHPVK